MGNTWIIDMSHFDYPEEETYTLPKQALKLWAFFGSIVDGTVGRPPFRRTAGIRCRRRPKRVPCSGVIESELHPNGNEIRWWCPVCGTTGLSPIGRVPAGIQRESTGQCLKSVSQSCSTGKRRKAAAGKRVTSISKARSSGMRRTGENFPRS